MKRPIFIIGPHRAGSTLWHNIIAMAPGILRLAEPRFLGAARQRDFRYFLRTQIGDLSEDRNIDRLVKLCFSRGDIPGLDGVLWKWVNMDLADEPALHDMISRRIKTSDRDLGVIACIIIEELTRFSGCERACVKFPVDVRYIHKLNEWFPDCRIVHITRDPRALAMSKSNDPSGTARRIAAHPRLAKLFKKLALALVISQYRMGARVHQRYRGLKNYNLFRYEDLLADPQKTLIALCEFVEIDFSEEMLEPQKGQHEHQPSSLTGKKQKAFDLAAAVRWKGVIPRLDNLIISRLTRKSMMQFGYDPDTHPVFRNQIARLAI